MKNKNLKLFVVTSAIILFVQLLSYSQKISWGPEIDRPKDYSPEVIEEVGNFFYTCSTSEKEMTLEKFEKSSLKNVYSKVYEIPKNHEKGMVLLSDNKFLVFFSFYDKIKKISELYVNTYSAENGLQTGTKLTITSVPVEKSERKELNRHRGLTEINKYDNYFFYKSSDNKKILIQHQVYSEKEEKYTNYYTLLDQNLNKLTEQEEVRGKSEYYFLDLLVNTDGSWFFQKNIIGGDSDKTIIVSYNAAKSFEKYEYVITGSSLNLSDKKNWIGTTNITFNKNGDMLLVGKYFKNNVYSGVYFIKFDSKAKQMVSFKLNEFNEEFTNQFSSALPEDFGGMQLTVKDDGNIIVLSSRYNNGTLTRTTKQNGFVQHEQVGEYFIYMDIIAMHLSADGNLLWANRIPCKQFYKYRFSSGAGKKLDHLSYFYALSNDKLFITYHDKSSNVAKTSDSEKLSRFKMSDKAVLALFTIDLSTGKKTKNTFPESTGMKMHPEPKTAFQKSENINTIFLGSANGKFQFGQFSFK